MKFLLQLKVKWLDVRSPSKEERYLAQSVDACDFEIRAQSLERIRG